MFLVEEIYGCPRPFGSVPIRVVEVVRSVVDSCENVDVLVCVEKRASDAGQSDYSDNTASGCCECGGKDSHTCRCQSNNAEQLKKMNEVKSDLRSIFGSFDEMRQNIVSGETDASKFVDYLDEAEGKLKVVLSSVEGMSKAVVAASKGVTFKKLDYSFLSKSEKDIEMDIQSIILSLAEYLEQQSSMEEVLYTVTDEQGNSANRRAFVVWNDDLVSSFEEVVLNVPYEGTVSILSSSHVNMYDAFDGYMNLAKMLLQYSMLSDTWDGKGVVVIEDNLFDKEVDDKSSIMDSIFVCIEGLKENIDDCHEERLKVLLSGERRFGRTSKGGESDEEKTAE